MTFGQIRFIKRMLLTLFVVSGTYVGYRVIEGARTRKTDEGAPPQGPAEPVSRGVAIEQLDSAGRIAWSLKAAESTGRNESSQQFRQVEIRFEAGEEKTPVVVTADDCEIRNEGSVFLRGDVVVRDDTSLRLEAETLHFERSADRIWTTDPVRYFREGLEGDAGSMRYAMARGVLELEGGVSMTFEDDEAPIHVTSASATMRRGQHLVQYVDEVRLRQAERALDCGDLQIYLTEDDSEITRVDAYESVDLRMNVSAPAEEEPESAADSSAPALSSRKELTSEPGTKRLLTDRLEMVFRAGGRDLERVRALEQGRLIITLPEGAREGFHKDLEGYTLAFEFDEEGRLQILRGRGGVTLTLTPVVPGEIKKIIARQLEADFDPETGDLVETRCEDDVNFEQGDVRASSQYGVFRSADSLLVLRDEPRLWDAKASLEAQEIEIGVDSGEVAGKGGVRSRSDRAASDGESGGLFPAAGKEPVFFFSEQVRYLPSKDTAVYSGGARGVQGANRIEAERIEIDQSQKELSAEGGVRTVFLQKVGREQAELEPTVSDSTRFLYVSKDGKLHYQDGVSMRSKDMTLKGREVDVTLAPGGVEVVEMYAQGEVTIETPDGTARGETAKYLPKDESMTVTGESAQLENAGKLTEGKQLTFFLGDDRIFVDGREQTRTKTTYTSKPRP
jgi:LPS export ABC transporter protein LptC